MQVHKVSSHFHLSSSGLPREVRLQVASASPFLRPPPPHRLPSPEWAPYPQRRRGSPRRTTKRWPAAPCSPSRTSRRAQRPEFARRFLLPGPALRGRCGGATGAAAQDSGTREAEVPWLRPPLRRRLRVQVGEDIPAAGYPWDSRGAQVMPRAGGGNPTMHWQLSWGPGTLRTVEKGAEALGCGAGRGGGDGGGAPPLQPAPPLALHRPGCNTP